jgi:hypothetical protein
MIGLWDILLIAAVSLQSTALAFMYRPQLKAFVLMLPLAFFFANMTLRLPVSVHHLAGQPLILLYLAWIYVLYFLLRVPILPAIAGSLVFYCGTARLLVRLLPTVIPWLFWGFLVLDVVLGVAFFFWMGHRPEPGSRTPLPLVVKLPCIAAIVLGLVILKNWLGGFMTVFPMVTTIAAYEARNCLWTVIRQMCVNAALFAVMIGVVYVAQQYGRFPMVPALLCGWAGYFLAMAVCHHWMPGSSLPAECAEALPDGRGSRGRSLSGERKEEEGTRPEPSEPRRW